MNILFLSVCPWAPTGYGSQTAQATARMKAAGHNVAISCTAGLQWAQIEWEGIHIYPADYTRLNKRMLRHHVKDWARRCECDPADVQIISLFDIWPWVDPAPVFGGIVADFKGLRIASWLPVDAYPLVPKMSAALTAFDVRPIAMSRFGQKTLGEAEFDNSLYVPHAIDTSTYRPLEDRDRCRRVVGVKPDKFVIGMVAHNEGLQPARKAFPNVLQAFSVFRQNHDDAVLYLHSEVTGRAWGGLNLLGMAQHFGIPRDALVPVEQIAYLSGAITPETMCELYNGMDVLANPSYGEGFGLPIVEAQACGTPVIASEWTAMPELVGAGWTVGGQPFFHESSGSWWLHPDTEQIVAAFETAYEHRQDEALREQAREFALAYDADRVYGEHWVPTLDALDRPREVPPLPNRAMRRAMAKAAK